MIGFLGKVKNKSLFNTTIMNEYSWMCTFNSEMNQKCDVYIARSRMNLIVFLILNMEREKKNVNCCIIISC